VTPLNQDLAHHAIVQAENGINDPAPSHSHNSSDQVIAGFNR